MIFEVREVKTQVQALVNKYRSKLGKHSKMEIKKFDPVVPQHILYKEAKLK